MSSVVVKDGRVTVTEDPVSLPIPAGGRPRYVSSAFGRTGAVLAQPGDYSKADVGLGDADNTDDMSKPISNPVQAALAAKADATALADEANARATTDLLMLLLDGTRAMTGDLMLNGHRATGAADSVTNTGLTTLRQVNTLIAAAITGLEGGDVVDTIAALRALVDSEDDELTTVLSQLGGKLGISANLADLSDPAAARGNLGMGSVDNVRDIDKPVSTLQQAALDLKASIARIVATGSGLTGGGNLSADRTIAVDWGTGASQVRRGNDAAFTDARTPLGHHLSHAIGGSDPITLADLGLDTAATHPASDFAGAAATTTALAGKAPSTALAPGLASSHGHRTSALAAIVAKQQLAPFTTWCAARGVPAYVAEFGIPMVPKSGAAAIAWLGERSRWEALLERVLAQLDSTATHFTYWDTNERGSTGSPTLGAYVCSPTNDYLDPLADGVVNTPTPAGVILERHLKMGRVTAASTQPTRGVVYSMGAYGSQIGYAADSTFSNTRDAGTFDLPGSRITSYNYGSAQTYAYLASRGIRTVRLNFRFERLFRNSTPAAPVLDPTEIQRVKDAIDAAHSVGIQVILTSTQNGTFYLDDGAHGQPQALGSANYSQAQYAELWRLVAAALAGRAGVFGYHIDNEPGGAPNPMTQATWDAAAQAAVTAIRTADMATWIMVPLMQSSVSAPEIGGAGFIVDPASHFMYEAHVYPDGAGTYTQTYDTIQANLLANTGYGPYCAPDDTFDLRAAQVTLRQAATSAYFSYDRDDVAHHLKRGAFYVSGGLLRLWSEESGADVLQVNGANGNMVPKSSGSPGLGWGTVASWRASGAPAAVATTLTAWYTNIAAFTVVTGRRYKVHIRVKAFGSAITTSNHGVLLCLGNAAGGQVIVDVRLPASTGGSQTYAGWGTFVGGTDVAAGAQSFTLEAVAASANFTCNWTAGAANVPSNPEVLIEDVGV